MKGTTGGLVCWLYPNRSRQRQLHNNNNDNTHTTPAPSLIGYTYMPVTLSSPVAVVLLPATAAAPPDPLLIIILHEPALICSFVRNNIILNTFHPPPLLSTKRYYRLPRRHPPTAYSLRTAMMRCDSVLDRILSQRQPLQTRTHLVALLSLFMSS